MTKNSLILLVVILVVGFAVWFSRFGKELKKTQEIVTDQQADTRQILRRQRAAIADRAPSPNEAAKVRLQEDLNALSQQMVQENQKLEALKQQREDILKQYSPQAEMDYHSQIRDAQFEIQSLNDNLRGMQWQEADIGRQATQIQREQDSNMRLYQEQMDQNIRDQEAYIRDSQSQLEYWTLNDTGYYDRQRERIQYFETLLAEQTQQLENMKIQRIQLASQAAQQTQNIQNQVRQTASTADEDRAAIQDQITSLREDIARLEYARRQNLSKRATAQNQVQQIDQNIRGQQETVRSIQNLMREKKTELDSIQ